MKKLLALALAIGTINCGLPKINFNSSSKRLNDAKVWACSTLAASGLLGYFSNKLFTENEYRYPAALSAATVAAFNAASHVYFVSQQPEIKISQGKKELADLEADSAWEKTVDQLIQEFDDSSDIPLVCAYWKLEKAKQKTNSNIYALSQTIKNYPEFAEQCQPILRNFKQIKFKIVSKVEQLRKHAEWVFQIQLYYERELAKEIAKTKPEYYRSILDTIPHLG